MFVSILVLMDFSLQSRKGIPPISANSCFNPCFNGFFSSIKKSYSGDPDNNRFNPCFNGFFSSISEKTKAALMAIAFQSLF